MVERVGGVGINLVVVRGVVGRVDDARAEALHFLADLAVFVLLEGPRGGGEDRLLGEVGEDEVEAHATAFGANGAQKGALDLELGADAGEGTGAALAIDVAREAFDVVGDFRKFFGRRQAGAGGGATGLGDFDDLAVGQIAGALDAQEVLADGQVIERQRGETALLAVDEDARARRRGLDDQSAEAALARHAVLHLAVDEHERLVEGRAVELERAVHRQNVGDGRARRVLLALEELNARQVDQRVADLAAAIQGSGRRRELVERRAEVFFGHVDVARVDLALGLTDSGADLLACRDGGDGGRVAQRVL